MPPPSGFSFCHHGITGSDLDVFRLWEDFDDFFVFEVFSDDLDDLFDVWWDWLLFDDSGFFTSRGCFLLS